MITVTPRLTEILKERGITQVQLSQMSGVPQGSISRFDKNNRHEDAHLFAIARALGVKVDDLFTVTVHE
jgi:transcriptional regulator with XRE-family HTH domain